MSSPLLALMLSAISSFLRSSWQPLDRIPSQRGRKPSRRCHESNQFISVSNALSTLSTLLRSHWLSLQPSDKYFGRCASRLNGAIVRGSLVTDDELCRPLLDYNQSCHLFEDQALAAGDIGDCRRYVLIPERDSVGVRERLRMRQAERARLCLNCALPEHTL